MFARRTMRETAADAPKQCEMLTHKPFEDTPQEKACMTSNFDANPTCGGRGDRAKRRAKTHKNKQLKLW